MKNKKIIVILLMLVMLTTGCTKNFVDKETNKSYTKNILCKPTETSTVEVYQRNEKDLGYKLEELGSCENFKINQNGYEGLWTSIFVKPLAWLIVKLGNLVNNYGLSIIILGILLRVAMIPLTAKSAAMSENMNKAKPELDRLEKKYANKTDQESMMKKSQEMMLIYQKYQINPVAGCLTAFIQLPILFAFLEAINRVPIIFEGNLLWFELGTTPWVAITEGKLYYLVIVALIVLTTHYSFKNMNTASMDDAQAKQMQSMNKFMVIFISLISFSLPMAIALYWIATSGFSIIQTIVQKRLKDSPRNKSTKKSKK